VAEAKHAPNDDDHDRDVDADVHPFFDGLKSAPTAEVFLRHFLLGGPAGLVGPSPEKGQAMPPARPGARGAGGAAAAQRLAALAYQLHLPVEGVVRVCEEVCRRLENAAQGADAKGGGSGSGSGHVDAPKAPADSGGVNDPLLAKLDDKGHK